MTDRRSREHRLSFPLDEELAREMRETIDKVRSDPRDKDHVAALVDTVLKLTDAGLREYYVRPLERARAGTIALGTARVGIQTAKRGISVIANKLLRGMGEDQLRSIADSMEGFLIRAGAD